MANEPLDVLLRLRLLTIDQVRLALADCLATEALASARCSAIEAAIAHEMNTASALTSDDRAVEDFAAWLHRILPDQAAADAALLSAETRTKETRLVLAAARAGARAVEATLERNAAERVQQAGRVEQRELDEAARQPGDRSLSGSDRTAGGL
jgi:hypothetical protein